MFVTDETPPQQRAAAGRTGSLYRQQLGRLRLQEKPGEADHMTADPTGRVDTPELVGHLEEHKNDKLRLGSHAAVTVLAHKVNQASLRSFQEKKSKTPHILQRKHVKGV